MEKKLVVGILAHVDAGKTTLCESMLYIGKSIRSLGRVDHKNAFLDNNDIERQRGITIFAKLARINYNGCEIILLDTPGHVDFSTEMERTLEVIDVAVVVISGPGKVQGHTKTIVNLLRQKSIPIFFFVNKMDQEGTSAAEVRKSLKNCFGDCFITPGDVNKEDLGLSDEDKEEIALKDESILERYLSEGELNREDVLELIYKAKIYPCFFGSALKLEGVKELMDALSIMEFDKCIGCVKCNKDSNSKHDGEAFGARVYKVEKDDQNIRVTHVRITSGSVRVKEVVTGSSGWEEKINQIRLYSGTKYELVNEVHAGDICAFTGLSKTIPGEGIGCETKESSTQLEPVLLYKIILPQDFTYQEFLPKIRMLEQEDPSLKVRWDEETGQIEVRLMGELQTQVLKQIIHDRFNVDVEFDMGNVIYAETVANEVVGLGHFEPLRHYAEVHLLISPGKSGSGVVIQSKCSDEVLARSWQKLIIQRLKEKSLKGVLTGSPLTDVEITLVSGRAHLKHTQGPDFDRAAVSALRQGLMQADNVLLEPYYNFTLDIPTECIGRALTDMEMMNATCEPPIIEGETAVITGQAPVACIRDYYLKVVAYTKGLGHIFTSFGGYMPCHNADEVIMAKRYNPLADKENSPDSVFCKNGAGFVVPWDQVSEYIHLENEANMLDRETDNTKENEVKVAKTDRYTGTYEQDKELEEIFSRTYRSSAGTQKRDIFRRKPIKEAKEKTYAPAKIEKKEEYLLVDGYNIIFAWPELNDIAKDNIDAARQKLLDIMCNYQGFVGCNLIVVFDAYKVKGNVCEMSRYNNISVVYTKEAQTADSYIEKFAHEHKHKYSITVATSDRLEQMIIMGEGCMRISAREFLAETQRIDDRIRDEYLQ